LLGGSKMLAASATKRVLIKAPVHSLPPTSVVSAPSPGSAGDIRFRGPISLPPHSIVATGSSSGAPDGFLGEVVSVRSEGTDTVATTVPTSLLAAAPQGAIDVTAGDTGPSGKATGKRARAAAPQPLSQQIKNNFSCEAGGEISLSGSVSLRPRVSFKAHWSLFHGVDKASFTGTATATASLSADAHGSASCTLKKTPLLAHPWTLSPIDVQVGPVPVVIVPQVQLYISGKGEITADVSSSLGASVTASAGLSYDHGRIDAIHEFKHSFNFAAPHVTSSAHIGADLSPTLDLLFYGVAGPQVTLSAGLAFDADPSADPWWTLKAPVDLGAKLRIPALDINSGTWTVYHHDFVLAQATTGPDGNGGQLGPAPPSAAQVGPLTVDSPARQIADYSRTDDLSCTLTTVEDGAHEFYTDGSSNDACGTFLAVGGQLYGPTTIPAGNNLGGYAQWTPVSQSDSGDGSPGNPYTAVTTVTAGDTGIQLTQTDRWLASGAVLETTYSLTSRDGDTQQVVLYRAADCYVGDSDNGTGTYDEAGQSVGCLHDNGDGTAIDQALVPIVGSAQSAEGVYNDIWAAVGSQAPLTGGAVTDPDYDNGEATSWALMLNGTNPITAESRFDFHTVPFSGDGT
jgi:hypothetical protein